MKHYWKQFTEWATNLKRNPFEQARLKLTGYYLVAMLFIVAIFSFVLINLVEKNIKDTLDDSVQDIQTRQEVFNRTSDDMQMMVLVVDGILLLLVGGFGYFLAGKTLLPIKKNFEAQKTFYSRCFSRSSHTSYYYEDGNGSCIRKGT